MAVIGIQSPDLALRSTPPPEEPKARRRRRKLLINEGDIVLSNAYIGRLLKDTSELKHFEENDPFSLVIWRYNERQLFFLSYTVKPLYNTLLVLFRNSAECDDLCNIYKEDFISPKVKMASSHEDRAEPSGNRSPPPGNGLRIEIKRLRDNQDLACTNLLSDILPSPNKLVSSPPRSMPSLSRRDEFTPVTATVGTQSDQMGRNMESGCTPHPT
ncbi:hypothetical protein HAX54_050108 [Datura stramonium]|uniref:Uncharacterized protein n=1 Tax=Datura stramonium TaxID=4076 RepID=A0ABS8SVV2_DATST|nr:hypothetical protein [Datura stramonium]